jgi:hypothetical protein
MPLIAESHAGLEVLSPAWAVRNQFLRNTFYKSLRNADFKLFAFARRVSAFRLTLRLNNANPVVTERVSALCW